MYSNMDLLCLFSLNLSPPFSFISLLISRQKTSANMLGVIRTANSNIDLVHYGWNCQGFFPTGAHTCNHISVLFHVLKSYKISGKKITNL
jgi:hypothetical protein